MLEGLGGEGAGGEVEDEPVVAEEEGEVGGEFVGEGGGLEVSG